MDGGRHAQLVLDLVELCGQAVKTGNHHQTIGGETADININVEKPVIEGCE
ncbi:hypothetical protein [Endozoicomonas sp. ONNA2]|uniref:hypothetical protein n=1 Tax=Endozoicomonas sp. ONNA2 TaxID=2828741 RepID=UPI0021499851|nr:hypothetical protein [Endozoicomonas sp. ONNA2]